MTKEELIKKMESHRIMAANLKSLKDSESNLRDEIVDEINKINSLKTGSNKGSLGDLDYKITKKMNYSIGADEYEEYKDQLEDFELDCIKTKRELSLSVYNLLSEDDIMFNEDGEQREITIDDIILCKEAKPTLEITLQE